MKSILREGFSGGEFCWRQSGMTLMDLLFIVVYMGITFSLGAYFVLPSSSMAALSWSPFLKMILSMAIGFITPIAIIATPNILTDGMKKHKGVVHWICKVLFYAYLSGCLWVWILLCQAFFRRMGWV